MVEHRIHNPKDVSSTLTSATHQNSTMAIQIKKNPNNQFNRGRYQPQRQRAHRINEDIREREIRLVGEDIEPGMYPIATALEMAKGQELDLVEISNQNGLAICRIVAYDKFLYQLKQKEKEKKKNSKGQEEKELRISPNTDTHDFNTKLKQAIEFLKEGNKVKFAMRFKGREVQHWKRGETMFKNFIEELKEFGTVESQSRLEGKRMFLTIKPKRAK